jgi:hypothetical protein
MASGTDYFVFPSSLYEAVPAFVLGRPGYDNWLLWFALDQGASLVNATADVLVVHQLHTSQTTMKSVEAEYNRHLAGWWPLTYTPADATHTLRDGRIYGARVQHFRNRTRVLREMGLGYLTHCNWLRAMLGKSLLESATNTKRTLSSSLNAFEADLKSRSHGQMNE